MKTVFAHTDVSNDYPSYVNISRSDEGQYVLNARSAGNGGRDMAQVILAPEVVELMAADLMAALHCAGMRVEPLGVRQADCMTFGNAIAALKAGNRVSRAGWNGKGMWLSLSCDGSREVAAENFWSPHNAEFARQSGGKATVLPSITMKTATGEILMGWLASQSDMLAEDWQIA